MYLVHFPFKIRCVGTYIMKLTPFIQVTHAHIFTFASSFEMKLASDYSARWGFAGGLNVRSCCLCSSYRSSLSSASLKLSTKSANGSPMLFFSSAVCILGICYVHPSKSHKTESNIVSACHTLYAVYLSCNGICNACTNVTCRVSLLVYIIYTYYGHIIYIYIIDT